jgi:branched-chain amino acid transport system permease protein
VKRRRHGYRSGYPGTTGRRPARRRPSALLDAAIAAFLWGFRIIIVLVIVVITDLSSGKYSIDTHRPPCGRCVPGGVYALIALGYTMVYGILRMINFAHGDVFMIGAFAGYYAAIFLRNIGFLNASPAASVISIVIMMAVAAMVAVVVAVLIERVAYRPLRNSPRLVLLIAAIGASFFLQYTVKGIVGTGVFAYPVPSFLSEPVALPIAESLRLKWLDVVVVGSAILMMVVLYLFVQRSKLGTAIRAVSEDAPTAALMGINVDRAIVATFAIGAAMAGIAGVLFGLVFIQINFLTGFLPGIKAFTAAVLTAWLIRGDGRRMCSLGEIRSVGPILFLEASASRRQASSRTSWPSRCSSSCSSSGPRASSVSALETRARARPACGRLEQLRPTAARRLARRHESRWSREPWSSTSAWSASCPSSASGRSSTRP